MPPSPHRLLWLEIAERQYLDLREDARALVDELWHCWSRTLPACPTRSTTPPPTIGARPSANTV